MDRPELPRFRRRGSQPRPRADGVNARRQGIAGLWLYNRLNAGLGDLRRTERIRLGLALRITLAFANRWATWATARQGPLLSTSTAANGATSGSPTSSASESGPSILDRA